MKKRVPEEPLPKKAGNSTNGKHRKPRTYGPIENLEAFVPIDWWDRIFNAYYLKTDGDVVNDQRITAQEVSLIEKILNPPKDAKILDLCCGQGRHVLEFARCGYTHVEGLDRSRYLIHRARKEASKYGLNAIFREGDARKLPYPDDTFDYVLILGNSFGYFETLEDDLRVLKEVYRVLKPSGVLFMDLADGDYLRSHYQPRSWEWIDENHFVCRERSLSRDGSRLISREVITHVEKGVLVDQFYAERLYNQRQLQEILQKCGFEDPTFHGSLTPESHRQQDLGMMEKRILLSTRSKKIFPTYKKRTFQRVKHHVAVLLGDPNKPDPLKPNHTFDEDDFYTIERLREALDHLPGYRFTYLCNHELFLKEIPRLKGEVDYVFNLCDEGFYNNPRKELHIPALLEMVGIPYTGAGPQCLAYCYDKSLIRGVSREMGIEVPHAVLIKPTDNVYQLPLQFPVLLKPNFGDSSFGITQKNVVSSPEELVEVIGELREKLGKDTPILAEEFLTGKDLTVGVIGNPPTFYRFLPIVEEDYSLLPEGLPRICGYEAKWLPDSPYSVLRSIPADLPEDLEREIMEACLKLFERLECRDYARFDLRLDKDGVPHLLEVNPNPGWCWDGHLAKMASLAGLSYSELLGLILESAEIRLGMREGIPQSFKVEGDLKNVSFGR
jgi:D-alanine-D-alanine ligase